MIKKKECKVFVVSRRMSFLGVEVLTGISACAALELQLHPDSQIKDGCLAKFLAPPLAASVSRDHSQPITNLLLCSQDVINRFININLQTGS